mgnify:CR=1 FL=1
MELPKSKILLISFSSILIVIINITEAKLFEFADMQKCAETGIFLYFYTFIGIHNHPKRIFFIMYPTKKETQMKQ